MSDDTDLDPQETASPRRAWAQQPITIAEAKAAKEKLEQALVGLHGACANSSDPKVARIYGNVECLLALYSMFVRSEHPEAGAATATFVFRKR